MKPNAWQNRNKPVSSLTLNDWLGKARQALRSIPDEPASSLYAISAYTLGKPRAWIQTHPEFILEPELIKKLDGSLKRLLAGEPLPYITGVQAFFGFDFHVTPDVLIPRPETELLVETALDWLESHPGKHNAIDVGTGSGCITISIASNNPDVRILSTDRSFASLQVARENILTHQLDNRIRLLQADLLSGIQTHFDLICANLPYIPTYKLANLKVSQYEPKSALDGGEDGLRFINRLLQQIRALDHQGSLVLLEIESGQSAAIKTLIHSHFPEAGVTITNDLNNLPRLVKISL